MLSPFEFAALSRDRYEERLREAARNHAFDAAVNRFIRSTLAASGRRLAALRNAFIPTLTVLGLAFAWVMAGAIMTETIFAWPGIGRYAVEAAANLDYPAVLGTTVLFAVIFMVTNLVVDILYCVLDPRIRQV